PHRSVHALCIAAAGKYANSFCHVILLCKFLDFTRILLQEASLFTMLYTQNKELWKGTPEFFNLLVLPRSYFTVRYGDLDLTANNRMKDLTTLIAVTITMTVITMAGMEWKSRDTSSAASV